MTDKLQQFEQRPEAYAVPPRRKEAFQPIYDVIAERGIRSVLDIGTAAGDFLYFLPDQVDGYGFDKSVDLVALAKAERAKPNLAFHQGDLFDRQGFEGFLADAATPRGHAIARDGLDCVTLIGALNGFLDFVPVFDRLFEIPGWRTLVVMAPVNEHPVHCRTHSFELLRPEAGWQSSYNIFAIAGIDDYLAGKSFKAKRWTKFEMKTKLNPTPSDPVRAWHVDLPNGGRLQRNGLGIILTEYVLVIDR
jgi:hypothetical protein